MNETRDIKIPLTKEEFTALPPEERDWKIVEMFCGQVQHCSGRFNVIEKKVSWFRHFIIVGSAFAAGAGVLKIDAILKLIGFL